LIASNFTLFTSSIRLANPMHVCSCVSQLFGYSFGVVGSS
jgi:hypothetical protein